MAKNIEPKLRKIGDYLKLEEDSVFVIPAYMINFIIALIYNFMAK